MLAVLIELFHWINTVLVNLKTSLSGDCHAFGHSVYAYLGTITDRFNRPFDLYIPCPTDCR